MTTSSSSASSAAASAINPHHHRLPVADPPLSSSTAYNYQSLSSSQHHHHHHRYSNDDHLSTDPYWSGGRSAGVGSLDRAERDRPYVSSSSAGGHISGDDLLLPTDNRKFTERRKKTVRFDGPETADDWLRWDSDRQGSQDSATKDSGIETSSTFTSSEDSNRGDGPSKVCALTKKKKIHLSFLIF